MNEPYIQPLWAVTFEHQETGARQVVTGSGESKQQGIDEAAWKLEGGPWHYVEAHRITPEY